MSHKQAAGHGLGVVTVEDPVKGGFTATFTLKKEFSITDLTQEDLSISIGFNKVKELAFESLIFSCADPIWRI